MLPYLSPGDPLGTPWGPLGDLLGTPWDPLETPWGPLGQSLGIPGDPWGLFGALEEPLGYPLGLFGYVLRFLGETLATFWNHLEVLLDTLGASQGLLVGDLELQRPLKGPQRDPRETIWEHLARFESIHEAIRCNMQKPSNLL